MKYKGKGNFQLLNYSLHQLSKLINRRNAQLKIYARRIARLLLFFNFFTFFTLTLTHLFLLISPPPLLSPILSIPPQLQLQPLLHTAPVVATLLSPALPTLTTKGNSSPVHLLLELLCLCTSAAPTLWVVLPLCLCLSVHPPGLSLSASTFVAVLTDKAKV